MTHSALFGFERRAAVGCLLDFDADPAAAGSAPAAWPRRAPHAAAGVWAEVAGPDRARIAGALKASAAAGEGAEFDYALIGTGAGAARRLRIRVCDLADGARLAIGLGHDPSFLPGASFAAQQALLQALFDAAPQGLALFDEEDRLLAWSDRFAALFGAAGALLRPGVAAADLDRLSLALGLAATDDPIAWLARREAARRAPGVAEEWRGAGARATIAEERRLPDGGLLSVRADLTAHRETERRLRAADEAARLRASELALTRSRLDHEARHDRLTGLADRAALETALERRLAERAEGGGGFVWALHVDLDRFSQINDAHGRAAGDEALLQITRRLRAALEPGDVLARIGADEFALAPGAALTRPAAERRAEALLAALRHPIEINGGQCWIGGSIGLAHCEGGAVGPGGLLRNAGVALSRAKANGRNRCELFAPSDGRAAIERKIFADDLRNALDCGEIEVLYQPQLSARSLEIVGVEALARWRHPERGLLTPESFLAVAEEHDLLRAIDARVMRRALADVAQLRRGGIAAMRVSVNVSAKRLADPALAEDIAALSPGPGALSLELLETIFLDQLDASVLETVGRLREQGVEIEIDDFGTGRASMLGLLKLRPRRLKIDRQLVIPMLASEDERALVASIIDIARALEIEIVAEGVESMRHAALLAELGCDLLQGFAFSEPLSFEALCDVLRRPPWRVAAEPALSAAPEAATAAALAAPKTATGILKPLLDSAR